MDYNPANFDADNSHGSSGDQKSSDENLFAQNAEKTADDLIREIANLRGEVSEIKSNFEIFDRQYKFWGDKEQELLKQLSVARDAKTKAKDQRDQGNYQVRDIEQNITKLERELRRKQLQEAEFNRFADTARQMDLDTAGRPWREFAYDHQIIGAKRLAFVKRGFLGDKMGLGKTLTSLIYADMVNAKRVLIFAPKETLANFEREIQHWAGDRPLISLVSKSKSVRDIFLTAIRTVEADQYIITVNLEAWRKDPELIDDLIAIKPDTVIIDEAHAIKKRSTKAFEGIDDIVYANNECPSCGGSEFWNRRIVPPDAWGAQPAWVCKNCEYKTWDQVDICSVKNVLPMTGTPILNKPQELWPLLYLIDKKAYPREKDFLVDFCVMECPHGCYYCSHTKRWKFKKGGLEALSKKIGGQFIMRDRKSAGIIIPPQEVQVYNLNFSKQSYPEQWQAYKSLATHYAVLLGSDQVLSVPAFIALLTRFRQMMTWPAGIELKDENGIPLYRCEVNQSIKLDRAESLAKELIEAGEKVVLFSQFKTPLHELHKRLNGFYLEDENKTISSVVLDGATDDYTKELIKDDFDAKTNSSHDRYDIVLCNYRVGGQSLNFTAAAHTIILDEEWNPGKRDQAYARTDRIGQTRETTVHLLRCYNEELASHGIMLIDEFMAGLMDEKANLVEGFESTTKSTAAAILDMLKRTLEEG